MSDVADIIKTTHEILHAGQDVPIVVDARNLGMAYAIPRGSDSTVAGDYSPWSPSEISGSFSRQSAVTGLDIVRIKLILSWRYSQAQQYIIDAFLDKEWVHRDPGADVSITVRFSQPTLYDVVLEAYQIPYIIDVYYAAPVGEANSSRYEGYIQADGEGTMRQTSNQ